MTPYDSTPTAQDKQALLDDLVDANHILFDEGVLDAFGHISIRDPDDPERFLLARNMAPGLVTRDDILTFELDGTPVDADGRKVYLERFIHGEIYRLRPDVMAVVHSHSPSVVPFSAVKSTPLRPMCHMSGFLGDGAPIFEIRDVAGTATDLLIRDRALGASLADSLGENNVVLMRGHGATVTAATLKQAVYRAIYVEVNARLQADALRLGPVEYLTAGEARSAMETTEGQVERPWQLWKQRARQARATSTS
ncbi:class II aldolase/adducin family protein [Vreelandella alkaliphila]|jgi:HCOMODA/2-hydroxy-3-carboxy-muconic semialdehyde decarboxylase|uniref:Aldolase n=1 Tax=Vreelandella aquamarina TaxID=77097 RepID=A0A857GPD1_9GAMM|nr:MULTISPECIES: class II aldolase/adducin family protein [Halomonas]QHD51193.1 aldolase [Halomonas meridiana]QPL45902.1 class II aldolase/adducin family protein [Halomonas sp. A40-4]